MTRTRTRSTVPVPCTCENRRHEHGTNPMYNAHRCGCVDCCAAHAAARRKYYKPKSKPEPKPVPVSGPCGDLFVATFPYDGGLSRPRLARILRPHVAALAATQGVRVLAGELRVRIDRTGAGTFVVAAVPAVSERSAAEVRARAAEFAYEHEQAHPRLAGWVKAHLQVAEEVSA